MDQIKIGRFIAQRRRDLDLTQRQLADRLDISDKTVSKWERGNGFPEPSLLLPLCRELGVTVNDLLSGEVVAPADYQQKAEENIMSILQENRRRLALTTMAGISSTLAFLTLLLGVAIYAEVFSLAAKITIVAIACVVFGLGLYVAMKGEQTIGAYRCPHCGKDFVPTFKAYMMGPHMLLTRRMRCPHCHEKGWCHKVLDTEGS